LLPPIEPTSWVQVIALGHVQNVPASSVPPFAFAHRHEQ